jgi:hypothetical protein
VFGLPARGTRANPLRCGPATRIADLDAQQQPMPTGPGVQPATTKGGAARGGFSRVRRFLETAAAAAGSLVLSSA